MSTRTRRPRLAVIVANGITGDSRVQKTALAAARAGWEVTLIGASPDGRLKKTSMGPVQVIRVPVGNQMRQRAKGHRLRRYATQFGMPNKEALARQRAAHQVWVRDTTARIGWLRESGSRSAALRAIATPAGRALGASVRIRRAVHQLRVRAFNWEQRRTGRPTGNWRRDWPQLLDLDLAFGPVIEELKPDLIHANDITMINTAAQCVARMRARGERVSWLYDAHEYVRGVDWTKPEHTTAFPAVEREYIGRADAVVTVSPEIAELLKRDYRLPKLPLVVRNTPIRAAIGTGEPRRSVREVAGLTPDVPLLVYSGWISAERGLGTAVNALPALPDCHLAIVAGRTSPELELLLERAESLGVRQRLHVVPYVPQHAVADYLSSADLGLICSQRTLNYEISLPTKLAEYLHAGLPVVASDVKTLSEYVRRHGVGEVFRADDVSSFVDTVTRAMANRRELAERITEAILAELSWEEQSAGLLDLYRAIAPVAPTDPCPEVSWSVEERPTVAAPPVAAARPDHARPLAGWRPLGDTPVRLGLGPANYAGQAAAFAQAICRDNPKISVEVVMSKLRTSGDYPADVYLDASQLRDVDLQAARVRQVLSNYTHLLVDAFMPVFGHLNGDNIEGDLPALRRAGIKVGILAHGSEIRHPGRHLQRHEYSLFRDAPEGTVPRLTALAERNRRVADECGVPLFVTTPDLLDDLPTAAWVPLVVDVRAWQSEQPVLARSRPIVLHAPSARWTKGTDRILPVVRELHDRGVIDFRLAEGIAWPDMRELVKSCDIVLDQFTTGSYGTFAVEAMAAGRPVIGYLSDGVRQVVGPDLPIVSSAPQDLRSTLESLVADPAGTAEIGAASVRYAHTYHDGTMTARALAEFLG